MDTALKIPDDQYRQWIAELSNRYQRSQIKAATSVNSELLAFYWSLGRDIVTMNTESKYGSSFFDNLSGWWSRRIDEENRIVYRVQDDAIVIASCRNHYDEQ